MIAFRLLLASVVVAASVLPATALVIRHDTPTLSYENYGREPKFSASTGIVRGNDTDYGIAGATAIDSRWGVHARHTLRHVQTWMEGGNTAKLRGTKWNGWNFQGLANVNVSEVIHFDDDFTRFANAIDIALVRTDAASSTLRIATLFGGWDEVGRVGSGASAANNRRDGNGDDRKAEGVSTSNSGRPYETRWAGQNDINQVNSSGLGSPANALLKVDFDHPTDTSFNLMGGSTAIDLEYGSMNGDSGSPIYIDKDGLDGQVAGVLSGGSGNTYGSTVIYVRIRPYRTWITDTILANPDTRTLEVDAVPDQFVDVGQLIELVVSSSGSEQAPLTPSFSLIDAPGGASIDPVTGEFSWTPTGNYAGTSQTITVEVTEDGEVANSVTTSFGVTISGDGEMPFWDWSAAPPAWSSVVISGGSPYGLASGSFPYLQGDTNTMIYQQVTGTVPRWATVSVQIKLADFNQTWSKGGPIEFGFLDAIPTPATAGADFRWSSVAQVPNFDSGSGLSNGLGNTGGNVSYYFSFDLQEDLVNPVFAVRKNADGNRFGVDDIVVSYHIGDADDDGIPGPEEVVLGTDPNVADTDEDGSDDGEELAANTDPLDPDSDDDAYADGHDPAPLDPSSPGGGNPLAVGINFVSSAGPAGDVFLPTNAYGGLPEISQRNWNHTRSMSGQSGATSDIELPMGGELVDSTGTPTAMSLSFTMNNNWSVPNEAFTPFGKLFTGYLDSSASRNCTVALGGIPYDSYDVYVYVGSDQNNRTGKITDGTTTYSLTTAARTTEPGEYLRTTDTGEGHPMANYAVFEGLTDPDLSLTYLRGVGNAGIHAVQIVSATQPSSYESWALGYGLDLAGDGLPGQDADFDGVDNMTEFVLASHPANPSARPAILFGEDVDGRWLEFVTSKAADGYTVRAEVSHGLDNWPPVPEIPVQMSEDIATRTYRILLPAGDTAPPFARLRITGP